LRNFFFVYYIVELEPFASLALLAVLLLCVEGGGKFRFPPPPFFLVGIQKTAVAVPLIKIFLT